MTTLTLELDDEQAAFIERELATGRYASAADVMRRAVEVYEAYADKDAALRDYLAPRFKSADAGQFVDDFSMDDVIAEADAL